MTPTTAPRAGAVAAEVGERVVLVADVDAREARLRSGPLAVRLPHPHSAEGRNLRRWLVQVLVTEALVEQEAAALGLLPDDPGPAPDAPRPVTLPAALRTGGVVAAVTASMPLARRLRDAVTAEVHVPETDVRAYYDRNLDRYTHPEVRHISRAEDTPGGPPDGTSGDPPSATSGLVPAGRPGGPSAGTSAGPSGGASGRTLGGRPSGGASLGPVRRGELAGPLEEAVFSAEEGQVVGPIDGPGGPWTLRVDRVDPGGRRPYEAVRAEIAAELTAVARTRFFTSWLDRRYSDHVHLHPGYEHPADPRHPDATHHH
ncbi:peptidyl-prolyl cis-trans isomerase [Sphaerisporangium album]|uniref:Periplasmic chaperone PpiD n=1 Tax=Sphaerisporangium album TaxID=509200 RepID=A0A367F660_9ACTN|nr:peptidylprolyl isomerase [Sphaerisporangium album]RCG25352.1 peptidyl-prolyl cis-trans isomerase [Sphaerisporangium album]